MYEVWGKKGIILIMIGDILNWKNAWRIRIVALGLIVLIVGVGTQVLVNAFAAETSPLMLEVSANSVQGRMADGNWPNTGACSVSTAQFPLGTIIALYNSDGSFNRQCTAEDTAATIDFGHVELVVPGNKAAVTQWGIRTMPAQILRWGWGGPPPIFSSAISSGIKLSPHQITKPDLRPASPAPRDERLRSLSRP
jgi:hypothetical protein